MTEEPPLDWRHPIPGNINAIQGEIDRVRALCDRCASGAHRLRTLAVPGWHGPAAEGFAAFRAAVAAQWEESEEAHRRWADALARYRDVLATVQALAKDAIRRAEADSNWAGVRADINRWRDEVSREGARAAAVLLDVDGQLRSLPNLLAAPVAPSVKPARTNRIPAEPPVRDQSPATLYRQVIAVCDAVLDADYVSAEQLTCR